MKEATNKIVKTRGAMYVASPFLLYIAGVVVVELGLTIAFWLFALLAERSGSALLMAIDHFLFVNEEVLIPALAGLIKIPHFLRDYYREDWEYRVEKKKALSGEYLFNMKEAGLWKGKKGILKSFKEMERPIMIVILALMACVFFNLFVNKLMDLFHIVYTRMALIGDVGGVGGPVSAIHFTGGDTVAHQTSLLVVIFSTVIVAPVVEELVFRGVIFQRMRDNHGFLISAVVSSIAFGIIHFNIIQGVFGFFMGMVFAYIYERYHKLTAVIAAHASVNILNIFMALPGIYPLYDAIGNSTGLFAGLMIVSGALLIILLLMLKARIKKKDYIPYSHVTKAEGGENG